jgi:predicted nucleotidyltransferase
MEPDNLPPQVKKFLDDFLQSAKVAFGEDLLSATLFGTAAEGKLRATSDVNLALVLKKFEQTAANKISEPLRVAHAAVRLEVMFILENEIHLAAESFAVKFTDIVNRHKVLTGKDYFTNLEIPAAALKRRLKQVLTNQILRLRERYVLVSLREEQLSKVIADAVAPLRSAAVSLLKLQNRSAANPKEALNGYVRERLKDAKWESALAGMSRAREGTLLAQGEPQRIYFLILELAELMLNDLAKLGA